MARDGCPLSRFLINEYRVSSAFSGKLAAVLVQVTNEVYPLHSLPTNALHSGSVLLVSMCEGQRNFFTNNLTLRNRRAETFAIVL